MCFSFIKDIQVCEEGEDLPGFSTSHNSTSKLGPGVRYAYPAAPVAETKQEEPASEEANEENLDDLMAKLRSLS